MLYHRLLWRPRASGRDAEKVWSSRISQFHTEKNKSWKSPIPLLSLPFLTLTFQTHSAVFSSLFLHYWRQLRKSSSICKCGLVRFIRALLQFIRNSDTCWAVPIKIQPLFLMAPGNEIPGYAACIPMYTQEKEHFLLQNYCAHPRSSTEEIYAPKSLSSAWKTTATCGCALYTSLYFSWERCSVI